MLFLRWYDTALTGLCLDLLNPIKCCSEHFHHILLCNFQQQPYRRKLARRFSPTSSSDIAPSLDESLESGPFSDLQSDEDEGRRSADPRLQQTAPPVDGSGCVALVQQLLEDIQCQKKDPDMWRKIEVLVD